MLHLQLVPSSLVYPLLFKKLVCRYVYVICKFRSLCDQIYMDNICIRLKQGHDSREISPLRQLPPATALNQATATQASAELPRSFKAVSQTQYLEQNYFRLSYLNPDTLSFFKLSRFICKRASQKQLIDEKQLTEIIQKTLRVYLKLFSR